MKVMIFPEKRYVHRVLPVALQVSLSIVCVVTVKSSLLAAQAGPLCRLTNCRNTAVREVATQELTEYCSLDHMQFVVALGILFVRWC